VPSLPLRLASSIGETNRKEKPHAKKRIKTSPQLRPKIKQVSQKKKNPTHFILFPSLLFLLKIEFACLLALSNAKTLLDAERAASIMADFIVRLGPTGRHNAIASIVPELCYLKVNHFDPSTLMDTIAALHLKTRRFQITRFTDSLLESVYFDCEVYMIALGLHLPWSQSGAFLIKALLTPSHDTQDVEIPAELRLILEAAVKSYSCRHRNVFNEDCLAVRVQFFKFFDLLTFVF